MNGIARLGELYNLSPSTLAGLAEIKGVQPPPPPVPIGPPAPPPVDPDSYEAWAAAAPPGAVKPADFSAGSPNPLARSNPNSPAAVTAGVAPDNPAAAEAAARKKALYEATPQGPAPDNFPTVKPMDDGSQAGVLGGAAMPGRVVPAHWQPGTHAVAVQRGMDPEALRTGQEEREIGAAHGLAAADARYEAAQRAGMADAIYASAHTAASQQANARLNQIANERARYVADQQAKFDKLNFEAQKQVDPNALWKEKGTGAQMFAALMIGLNQFAVAWSGRGQNTALQIIDGAIDRNIDAQKTNISNARAALDKEESLYARNLAEFGDRERATLATKVQYLDGVAAMLDGERAKVRTTEGEAAYHDMVEKLQEKRAMAADRFAELTQDRATEQMNEHFVPTQMVGGGAGVKGKDDQYVPTLGGYARSKEDAAKLNAKGAMRMQISENMRQIHELLEQSKSLNSVTDSVEIGRIDSKIQTLINDALTKNTVLEGQGAMSESDKAVAAEAKSLKGVSVRFKPDFVINGYQKGIKDAATNMLTQHRIEGEAYGIQKGAEQYVQGPNGPVPVQRLTGRNATPSKRTQGYDDLVQKPKGVAK